VKLAIIRARNIGSRLGTLFARNNHEVMFGCWQDLAEVQRLADACGPLNEPARKHLMDAWVFGAVAMMTESAPTCGPSVRGGR
jgi:predicted dinucleotide-binding enzyme